MFSNVVNCCKLVESLKQTDIFLLLLMVFWSSIFVNENNKKQKEIFIGTPAPREKKLYDTRYSNVYMKLKKIQRTQKNNIKEPFFYI